MKENVQRMYSYNGKYYKTFSEDWQMVVDNNRKRRNERVLFNTVMTPFTLYLRNRILWRSRLLDAKWYVATWTESDIKESIKCPFRGPIRSRRVWELEGEPDLGCGSYTEMRRLSCFGHLHLSVKGFQEERFRSETGGRIKYTTSEIRGSTNWAEEYFPRICIWISDTLVQ